MSTAHDLGDSRLHRISSALTRQGIDHVISAVGDEGFRPEGAQGVRAARHTTRTSRLWRAVSGPWRATDVLVVVDPDAVPMGIVAARLLRRRLVVDLHEDYEKVAQDRTWSRGFIVPIARGAARLATSLASRADLTVVADNHLPPKQARNRLVVRNFPRAGEIPTSQERSRQPRAIYVGDLRPSRGLYAMIDALADAPTWSLDLVGNLSEVQSVELQAQLERAGLVDRVKLHGRLPPDHAWAIASGAWCGLSLLADTPAYREALPTKLYEYLAAGLPIISSDLPRSRDFINITGAGRLARNSVEVATILKAWQHDPSQRDLLASEARRWASQALSPGSDFDLLATEIAVLVQSTRKPGVP